MIRRIGLVLALLLIVLAALLFSALNPARIRIEIVFAAVTAPLGLALISAFSLGLIVGVLVRSRWVASLLAERGRLRRALKASSVNRSRDLASVSDNDA
jgi:uncharacterized integral membrane protein